MEPSGVGLVIGPVEGPDQGIFVCRIVLVADIVAQVLKETDDVLLEDPSGYGSHASQCGPVPCR
ncbi:hypothetical protein JCM9533A_23550 [Catenuloplanes niger JCM 9533]